MDERLSCNFKRCQVALTSSAWVTGCYHIFCDEHSPGYDDETERRCSLCLTSLSGKRDLFQVNLNPPEEMKSIMLAGLSPSKIMQIGSKALSFWKFQMFQEKLILKTSVKDMQSRLARTESNYETLIEKLKTVIQQERQKCEKFESELHSLIKKTQEIEVKNERKWRQMLNSHMMFDAQRKQHKPFHVGLQNCRNNEPKNCFSPHRSVRPKISPNFINRVQNLNMGYISSSQQIPPPSPQQVFNVYPRASQN